VSKGDTGEVSDIAEEEGKNGDHVVGGKKDPVHEDKNSGMQGMINGDSSELEATSSSPLKKSSRDDGRLRNDKFAENPAAKRRKTLVGVAVSPKGGEDVSVPSDHPAADTEETTTEKSVLLLDLPPIIKEVNSMDQSGGEVGESNKGGATCGKGITNKNAIQLLRAKILLFEESSLLGQRNDMELCTDKHCTEILSTVKEKALQKPGFPLPVRVVPIFRPVPMNPSQEASPFPAEEVADGPRDNTSDKIKKKISVQESADNLPSYENHTDRLSLVISPKASSLKRHAVPGPVAVISPHESPILLADPDASDKALGRESGSEDIDRRVSPPVKRLSDEPLHVDEEQKLEVAVSERVKELEKKVGKLEEEKAVLEEENKRISKEALEHSKRALEQENANKLILERLLKRRDEKRLISERAAVLEKEKSIISERVSELELEKVAISEKLAKEETRSKDLERTIVEMVNEKGRLERENRPMKDRVSNVSERVVALMDHIKMMIVEANTGKKAQQWKITAPRDTILSQMLHRTEKWKNWNILKMNPIAFEKEDGLDQGGLSRDLYSEFFKQLLRPLNKADEELFLGADGSLHGCFLPNHTLKPSKELRSKFKGVGMLILRCIALDYTPIPPELRLVIYYLTDSTPPADAFHALNLLELYDPQQSKSLRNLLKADATELSMSVSDILDILPSSSAIPPGPLTNGNKNAVVLQRIRYILYDRQDWQWGSILEGFNTVKLRSHLNMFTGEEMADLFCGHKCTHDDIARSLDFDFNEMYSVDVEAHFLRWIARLSLDDCSLLLRCVTGFALFPARGLQKKLRVRSVEPTQYPSVSTCDFRIDLPCDKEYGVLEHKLGVLLCHQRENEGFTMK